MEFWVTPPLNREQQKLDIHVWHPRFNCMEKRGYRVLL